MKKNIIKISEKDLSNLIKESVNKIMQESIKPKRYRMYCAYCVEDNATKARYVIHSLQSDAKGDESFVEDNIINELLNNNSKYTLVSTTVLTGSNWLK